MTTFERLIERWKTGDESAAAEIYDLHRERIFRLAYALLGNLEDAEEAAQDALTYALLNIANYDSSRSKFTTWLHTITVSRSRDMLRKRRIPSISFSDWIRNLRNPWLTGRTSGITETSQPEQAAIRSEDRSTVWAAIQTLNPIFREAIVLRHWGGHTYQEIADITGCPIRTAQSRVRLAYKKLETTLENKSFAKTAEKIP